MIPDALLSKVKGQCNVTWFDEDTEKRIKDIIEDGYTEFSDRFGVFEYADLLLPGLRRNLFLAYCQYRYYDQFEDFNINYKKELLSLRLKYEVEEYEKETENKIS